MKWEKCGMIWMPQGELPWAKSHATLPVTHATASNKWPVYVSCRDEYGKSRIGRVELDVADLPRKLPTVCHVDSAPVLSLGAPGTFDDSGVMPAWLISDGDLLRLYYIGWNVTSTVPYRLSIGVAISDDNGKTFQRYSQGPVIDRSPH